MNKDIVKIYDDKAIRTVWDSDKEKWYISVVDVIAILTESVDPTAYWRKLKQRLKIEGNQTVTNCHGLKMLAEASIKDISEAVEPQNFDESKEIAKQGGNVAKVAKVELEAKTGKKVVTLLNTKATLEEKNQGKIENDKR